MARGGRRSGRPGVAHGNRTDLNKPKLPVKAGPSQFYGQRSELEEAQRAVPMGPPPAQPPPGGGRPRPAPGPQVEPGSLGSLNRPTERASEPLSNGLRAGPGAGPEALMRPRITDSMTLQLQALFERFPIQELADLLEDLDERGG